MRNAAVFAVVLTVVCPCAMASEAHTDAASPVWAVALEAMALAGFAAATLLLILAVSLPNLWTRAAASAAFVISAVALAVSFIVRWAASPGSWYMPPIVSQAEAITGSALLAAVLAIGVEVRLRRGYIALGAALYAAIAVLTGFFLPSEADAVSHGMFDSPLMPAHVAIIILGHALAGMTLFISLAYLALGVLRRGNGDHSSGADLASSAPRGALATIDRCNLITAQLAAWCLAVGTMLGAVWADVAWGRWWGWDIKETWALITTIIFLAVLHVRFVTAPRYRGLLTAIGCALGCGAMLFNWWAVNYLFTGLHSYG